MALQGVACIQDRVVEHAHPLLEALPPALLGLLAHVLCISCTRLLFIVDKECSERDDAGNNIGCVLSATIT